LPKTRSGKIIRRILRKIADGKENHDDLGDISTLADPHVLDEIEQKYRKNFTNKVY
jgi:acetyl-CoA synthetase